MKLIDSSFPVWGKLNEAGTMTSGRFASPPTPAPRSTSVRLDSISTGSTMKRSPATKAVMSASRLSEKMSRIRIGVSAATRPGSTHRLTSSATLT